MEKANVIRFLHYHKSFFSLLEVEMLLVVALNCI